VIIIAPACRRELETFPIDVRNDLADALGRLDAGLMLTMPLSRAMPGIGRQSMSYGFAIVQVTTGSSTRSFVVGRYMCCSAFKKTTQTTPRHHIDLARKRLKEITQ
jgi:phage-related protein